MPTPEAKRERALIEEIHNTVGLGIHAAVIVENNVLMLMRSFASLDEYELPKVRELVEKHGFRDAPWAKSLFE